MPRLSIAIPTYNRAGLIGDCITSVLDQLREDMELLVVDNASTDDTGQVVKSFAGSSGKIRYIRNEANIGPDGNFLKCLREATGDFVWLLSDDDVALPGAVDEVVRAISEAPRTGMLFLNYCGGFERLEEIPTKSAPVLPVEDLGGTDSGQVLERVGVNASFLSILVFNRAAFSKIENPERYQGTNLLQAHLAMIVALRWKARIVGKVCVAARGGNSGGYELYKVFSRQWHQVLFITGIGAGLATKTARRIFSKTIAENLRYWTILMRINPGKFKLSLRYLFPETLSYASAWVRLYPVLLSPRSLIKAIAIKKGLL